MGDKETFRDDLSACLSRQRSNSPDLSCVSMRSDLSIDQAMGFTGEHTSTDFRQRSNSSDLSCVSMKSDQSINQPVRFSEEGLWTDMRQRSNSPDLSCVSMRSDQSIDQAMRFTGEHTSNDLRSNSSEISCVSMKSYSSINLSQRLRLTSPDPSCVSMKSAQSIDQPMKFTRGQTFAVKRQRSNSPDLSCVSMKSDQSIDQPMRFSGEHTSDKKRLRLNSKSMKSMKNDKSIDQPIRFTGGVPLDEKSQDSQKRFKLYLLKKFQCVYEVTAMQGNPALLNEIYTELYITESESGEINNEHELRQIEVRSRRSATEDTPIQCRDIFTPLHGQDKAIRTVLTKGVAGIGKTVSVQKFIVDWAEEKENQDIQLIFPLPFREINLMKNRTLSLSDLLCVFFPETKEIKISSNKYKVLFIFDGLDECRLSLDFKKKRKLHDVSESASVDVLLMNLIMGNLLPSALIWITSRPAAADLIPSGFVHRVTEVRGFNDPQKEEYFRKRIRDQSQADTVISHLKSSRSLHIMCHIPVFCWISATVLKKIFSRAERGEIPKTLTEMYTHFLIIQTNIRHKKDYKEKVKDEDMILKLGKLALEQLVKGNLIFYEEDLRECGLDVTEASVYSGLCTQIFREEFGFSQMKVFCFVHLSIQEHLAALYAHHSFTNNCINIMNDVSWKTLNPLSGLHHRVLEEALQSKNGHLDLFLRFLLGLSLEFNQTLLRELLKQTGSCSYNKEETVQFIKLKIREINSPERSINLFHCLNELGDRSLMKEIQDYLSSGQIRTTKLSSFQWSALVYVLLTSEQEVDDFDLNQFIGAQHTADVVLQKLLPVVKASRSIQLSDCGVTDVGCVALASALRSNSSYMTELDLSANTLGDSGVKLLSDGLKDPHCKLEKLRLSHCGVTDEGCADLASALRSNPKHLTELNLTENKIGDSGVELLSDLQKDPQCKLKIMWLSECGVTAKGCADLASVLRLNSSHLTDLDLSKNKLRYVGVKLLSDGLKSPHCKLEILRLSYCEVTDEGCADLASALRSNSSHLTELDLNWNKLGDSGVKLLSDGLKDPHCKLEILKLYDCGITNEGCVALASALRSNPEHLTELDLSANTLGDSGVKLLSDLLKDPHCKLEILRLGYCGVTDVGCVALASTLILNSSHLIELDLTASKPGDLGVKLLSVLLKDPQCKLEILKLSECEITAKGCAALASALISNPSHLTELDLSKNKLGDSGMKLLTDLLKDPQCKLDKLWLWQCGVTAKGCVALASALKSNSSHLTDLNLTKNKLGDLGVKWLFDGLKDPHCKLELLRLSDCGVTDEGCAALASALRLNSSHLTLLDLSINTIGDSGVNLLSDGLKDPHCKLEILRLSDCRVRDEGCAALASALRSNPKHLTELDLSKNEIGESGMNVLLKLQKDPHKKLCCLQF